MFTTWDAVSAMDRIYDDVMGATVGAATSRRPLDVATDVCATEKEVTFRCDVPGVKPADLDVTIENRVLTIRGKRDYDAREGEQVLLGRAYGAFMRSFTLPDFLDDANLIAQLAEGVLTIRIPKQAKAQARKVQVNLGGGATEPTK